ncbi:hypothetical protein LTS10_004124 [Elasticomyces elasticus]|nr:hypothetical protein LTS10_004124 [Elasticomyces elasticus]
MSDSELSSAGNAPADAQIEECLRRIVRDALKADADMTVRIARSQAETELGLDAGFFKDDAKWKGRSKEIIEAAVEEPLSPEQPKKAAPKKAAPKPKAAPKTKAAPSKKRKSDEPIPKAKRSKKTASEVEDSDEEVSELSDKPASPALEDDDEPAEKPTATANAVEVAEKQANGDDSDDFSDVKDEAPAKKKRPKKSTSPSDTTAKPKKVAKPTKESTPDEDEIKKLQDWLKKCGIRKLWGKELAKYDTSKQKIKHLKGLLEEIGMTGRYSNDKADQIKESRELAADIEAAKDFDSKWGQKKKGRGDDEEDEEQEEKVQPKRLRPKGLVDFGDSGDEGSD